MYRKILMIFFWCVTTCSHLGYQKQNNIRLPGVVWGGPARVVRRRKSGAEPDLLEE